MIVEDKIPKEEMIKPFVKVAVDIQNEKVSVGCALHIDCANELIEAGSKGDDVWGLNIYPDGRLDYVSLINIRPKAGNRSVDIKNIELQQKIASIIQPKLVL